MRVVLMAFILALSFGCKSMPLVPGVTVDAHWNDEAKQVDAGIHVKVCSLLGAVALPGYAGLAFKWTSGILCEMDE